MTLPQIAGRAATLLSLGVVVWIVLSQVRESAGIRFPAAISPVGLTAVSIMATGAAAGTLWTRRRRREP